MSKCFGIKIILDDKYNPVAENTDIGLYNVAGGNSEFRWIQNSLSGLSNWKSGMIIENGMKEFSVSIDLKPCGNTSSPGSGSVIIKNNIKFNVTIEALGIDLQGLKLEVWYFNYDDSHSDSVKLRTYKCEKPSYTNSDYAIPYTGYQESRRSNILNIMTTVQYPFISSENIGKTIPAIFGKHIPGFDTVVEKMNRSTLSKFIRTYDKIESKFYTDSYFTESEYTNTFSFPIIGTATLIYTCSLRGSIIGVNDFNPIDTYVKIVDGTGKNQIRKVEYFSVFGPLLYFTISDYFEVELSDSDASEGGRSWVQFYKIYRRYDVDHMPCDGFYDSSGNKLINGAELYTFSENDGFARIAPYGYEFKGINESNNKIEIDPKLFDQGDIDTQNSFMILPIIDPSSNDSSDLSDWYVSGGPRWDLFTIHPSYDGLYSNSGGGFPDVINSFSIENLSNSIDKTYDTYGSISLDGQQNSGGCYYVEVIKFNLPELPNLFTFEKLFIGVRMKTKSLGGNRFFGSGYPSVSLKLRKFKFGIEEFVFDCDEYSGDGAIFDDIPDFYYTDDTYTGNKYFFETNNAADDDQLITGINNTYFDTGITSKEEYESYIEGTLWFERTYTVSSDPIPCTDDTKIYEICLIFKRESDIGKEIYTPFHGRTFSATWQGRKTESDLIEKPIDLLEHVCRLQDYRDTCPTPVSGWGLQYAGEPLIATTEFGSFDEPGTAESREYYAAAQIVDYEDGYTDTIKNKICTDFCLANWQDSDGYERVIPIPENKLSPVCTITLGDIVDRSKIKVNNLPQSFIYSEPFVKYDKNQATGEYESLIQIRNTSATIYNSSFVVGIQNAEEGQSLWQTCHSIALMCHQVNKPPTNFTDMQWANGAGSYTIAFNNIKHWINWMYNCKEIEFPTHFNIAGSWQECTPFNILLSHQTNNISKSCLVEECVVNPNHPYDVMIKAVMYA